MKIIVWDLPELQSTYLKINCIKYFENGEICIMTPESAMEVYADINAGKLAAKEIIVISQNPVILKESVAAGMITVAYQPPIDVAGAAGVTREAFPQVDMVIEGFEEVDYDFLKKIYQRYHGLPWTILETDRLVVRELELKDMDALFELYSYEGMTDYMEGLYSFEEEYEYQKAYIENMYCFFGYGMWLVFEKESGKLIGRAGVEHREELEGELELGYAIGTPWQGMGYATEVCRGILDYVREELGFEEIISLVQPENALSIRLLEKLRFKEDEEIILEGICYKKYKKTL